MQIKFLRLNRYFHLSICFLMLLLNISTLQANEALSPSYRWGQGYHIPAANLTLGGYFKASYSYFETTGNELALEDLSLFISWRPFSRLHLFSELELEDLFTLDGVRPFDEAFQVERLYADFLVSEEFTVRFGEYLTPFSRWNILHAAPLVWTSSRPIITKGYVIPQHATGLELLYNTLLLHRDFKLSFFADDSEDLGIDSHSNPFTYAFGTRLNYQIHHTLNIGSSYVYSKVDIGDQVDWQHTLGIDFLWQKDLYEVQLESFLSIRDNNNDHYGLYLQAVAPLMETLFVIGRYEYMYGSTNPDDVYAPEQHIQIGVMGLTWRPAAPLALKIEYRFGDHNQDIAPSGFLSSIAMFF